MTLWRRGLIYLIAFTCGAVVMSFEVLGIRVVAPDFGSYLFTWGSMISVVLAGLSIGYFLGGQLADRWRSFGGLAALLVAPAAMIGTFRYYAWDVSHWLFDRGLSDRTGALAASLLLFLIPTIFLGTVSPYTVQLRVEDVEHVGRGAGSIYAVSTFGSIVGTIGTSFFLIGWLPVSTCMMLLGDVLLLLAAVALFQHGRERERARAAGADA